MEFIKIESLWKTVALIVALAIFISPSASLPLWILYATLALVAVLLPVRSVSHRALITLVGSVSVAVGSWLYVRQDISEIQLAGFVLLGAVALLVPYTSRVHELAARGRR